MSELVNSLPVSNESSNAPKRSVADIQSLLKKFQRNDICFCESGKKFKKCHFRELELELKEAIQLEQMPKDYREYMDGVAHDEKANQEMDRLKKLIFNMPDALQKKYARMMAYVRDSDMENAKRLAEYLKKRVSAEVFQSVEIIFKFYDLAQSETPEKKYSLEEMKVLIEEAKEKNLIDDAYAQELLVVAQENFQENLKEDKPKSIFKRLWGKISGS
jgi:hypothetical protein